MDSSKHNIFVAVAIYQRSYFSNKKSSSGE